MDISKNADEMHPNEDESRRLGDDVLGKMHPSDSSDEETTAKRKAVESSIESSLARSIATTEIVGELRGKWKVVAAVALASAVLVGVILRFWTTSPLWLDEALTVNISRLPIHEIPAALKRDGAPPLFYVLLHFWMAIFGTSNLAVRSLSGILAVATLPIAWLGGKRYGGSRVAWAVLLLLATAPFAVYYGTEARMYALVMFLTAVGFLALDRAIHRARPGNLIAVFLIVAALLYSQYWALYLYGSLGLWLLWQAWKGKPDRRVNVRWTLLAVILAGVAFFPWLPIFIFQAQHTGTPWAKPPNFSAVINAITGFTDNQATLSNVASNQGRLLALIYFVLAGLALFGLARDRRHIDIDLYTRPRARGVSFVVAMTLFAAVAGGIISNSAFSPRYASVVFIPLILLIGLGVLTLADARIRVWVLVVAAVAGLITSAQNVDTQRTQAAQVASVINQHAKPGDVIAFCPDQLGPSVARILTNPTSYQMLTFPRRTGPEFVNWVNYKSVVHSASFSAFATLLERDAITHSYSGSAPSSGSGLSSVASGSARSSASSGSGLSSVASGSARSSAPSQIWLVWMPGYQGFGTKCEQIATTLLDQPGNGGHNWVIANAQHYYEPMNLTEFTVPSINTSLHS